MNGGFVSPGDYLSKHKPRLLLRLHMSDFESGFLLLPSQIGKGALAFLIPKSD
jgi:hypothetical protein